MNQILYTTRVCAALAVTALATLTAANVAAAHSYQLQSLHIDHPFARATPPGATSGGAYLTIHNQGTTADKLVSARSIGAGTVQLHTMSMDGGVMRMREIPGLDVPAGATVTFAPGGYHLMLLDLKKPLVAGEQLPMTLTFEHAGSIDMEVHVEGIGAAAPMSGMPAMPGMHDSAQH